MWPPYRSSCEKGEVSKVGIAIPCKVYHDGWCKAYYAYHPHSPSYPSYPYYPYYPSYPSYPYCHLREG